MKRRTVSLLLSVSLLAALVPVNAGELEGVSLEAETIDEAVAEMAEEAAEETVESAEEVFEEISEDASEDGMEMPEIIQSEDEDVQEEESEGLIFELETDGETVPEAEEILEVEAEDFLFGDALAEEEEIAEEKAETLEAKEIYVEASDWVDFGGSFKLKRQPAVLSAADTLEAEEVSSFEEADLPEDVEALWIEADEEAIEEAANITLFADADYYGASDGLLHVVTLLADGSVNEGDYFFSKDCYMCTNRVEVPAATPNFGYAEDSAYYFTDECDLEEGAEVNPATSDLGKLKRDFWHYTDYEPARFEYFDKTFGRLCTLEEYIAQHADYMGLITGSDGEQYHLDKNGVPQTGVITLDDGKEYYFDENSKIPGALKKNTWATGTTSAGTWWKYFTEDGSRKDINGTSEYAAVKGLDPELDSTVTSTDIYALDKNGYMKKNAILDVKFLDDTVIKAYFDADGKCLKGKPFKVGGKYHFAKNDYKLACKETIKYKGDVYYFGKDYKRVDDKLVTINGKQYYFGKTGKRTYKSTWGRVASDSNRFYYFDKNQAVVKKTGWQRIVVDGKSQGWFYFPKSGKHYVNKVRITSTGKMYYLQADGSAANGVKVVNGKAYYFKPSTKTKVYAYAMSGIIKNSGGLVAYYANPKTKVLKKGWMKINDYYYHFGSKYQAERNKAIKKGSKMGWLDSKGHWRKAGWFTEVMKNQAVKQYYIDPKTGKLLKNCWKNIDGLNYYFTADGSIHTKLDQLPGVKFDGYAVSVNTEKCMMTIFSRDWRTPIRVFKVSPGTDATPSLRGTFTLTSTGQRWTLLNGPTWGQWASHIWGDYLIHSVLYWRPDQYTLMPHTYNLLGTKQSHGCIRMRVSDAYWVFSHCNGSVIRLSPTEPTPFGNPGKWVLPGGISYDITDWNVKENHLTGPVW